MDPIALAVLVGFTEFNKFLQTPAGQKFAEGNNEIIAKLLGHFGVHLAVNDPPKS